MRRFSQTAIDILQRAGFVVGAVLNLLGAVQSTQEASAVWPVWVWVAAGTVLLVTSMGSALWRQRAEIERYQARPRPEIIYVEPWARQNLVRKQFGAAQITSITNAATEVLLGRGPTGIAPNYSVGDFQGLTFENRRTPAHPPMDAVRVSARLDFFQRDKQTLLASVPVARWPKNAERHQTLAAGDIETAPMPTGIPSDIDVFVRLDEDPNARIWTNDGARADVVLVAGTYSLRVRLESSDFADTVTYWFEVVVPDDCKAPISFTEDGATSQSAPSIASPQRTGAL